MLGRLPSSDLRSRMSSGGVSASATSLSTCGCHPPGPGNLLGFSYINLFLMITSVRVWALQSGDVLMVPLVKTLQKKEFSVHLLFVCGCHPSISHIQVTDPRCSFHPSADIVPECLYI